MRIKVALLLMIAACDSPSPWYDKASGKTEIVSGYTFRVHSNGRRAQAIRVSRERRPHVALVVPAAMIAIERATGCAILRDRAKGDTNVIVAQIDCP